MMKKFILGSLMISSLVFGGISFANEEDSNTDVVNVETSVNIEEDELQNAMEAGYTAAQYKQIMAIPQLADAPNLFSARAVMTTDQTKVINLAKVQIGKPYSWGAQGPSSFDCGGLVRYVYRNAMGIDIPMGTTNQETKGKEVSLSSLQPGDLLFYGSRGATYHVGIYAGNNQMIHAPQPGQNVTTVDIKYFYPQFARRILNENVIDVIEAKTEIGEISVGTNIYYQEGKLTNSADTSPGNDPWRGNGSAWIKAYYPGKKAPYLLVKNGVNIGYTTRANIARVSPIPTGSPQEGSVVNVIKISETPNALPTIVVNKESYWATQYIDGNVSSPYRLLKNGKTMGYTNTANIVK